MSENDGKAGYIARLWYQDNLNGQLLIGEAAWSPDGELVDVLPVCEERMQRVAVFAQWSELPADAERWFAEIREGGLDDYRLAPITVSYEDVPAVMNAIKGIWDLASPSTIRTILEAYARRVNEARGYTEVAK